MTLRIYVACLASYNNGVLHGRWIDASADVEEMQEEVNAILRESKFPNVTVECPECDGGGERFAPNGVDVEPCPNCREGRVPSAEEFAIHDFDGLPPTLGEYCGLQAVADYVELIEEVENHVSDPEEAAEVAKAAVENWHSVEYAKNAMDYFAGVYPSFRDYADGQADERLDAANAPDFLRTYFDYEGHARDLKMTETALDVPSGVAVFYEH